MSRPRLYLMGRMTAKLAAYVILSIFVYNWNGYNKIGREMCDVRVYDTVIIQQIKIYKYCI